MISSADIFEDRIRRAEFDLVRGEFVATDRVLEIGGGRGFQAIMISALVDECVSVDVREHPQSDFPIVIYDGRTIPFPDASFDRIFSSNVLEHVEDLDTLLDECARVLKPDGTMVHILPTHWWRIWTLLSYYPALPMIILASLRNLRQSKPPTTHREDDDSATLSPGSVSGVGLFTKLRRGFRLKWFSTLLLSPRHGDRGNVFTEIYYFRPAVWKKLFERNGWRIDEARPCHLFYSGNRLFGDRISLKARVGLSHVLGSSTFAFRLAREMVSRTE